MKEYASRIFWGGLGANAGRDGSDTHLRDPRAEYAASNLVESTWSTSHTSLVIGNLWFASKVMAKKGAVDSDDIRWDLVEIISAKLSTSRKPYLQHAVRLIRKN